MLRRWLSELEKGIRRCPPASTGVLQAAPIPNECRLTPPRCPDSSASRSACGTMGWKMKMTMLHHVWPFQAEGHATLREPLEKTDAMHAQAAALS